jgi:diguanylate cyclase (GGDEF)-like protein
VGKHVELLFAAWDVGVMPEVRAHPESPYQRDELTGLANRGNLQRQLADMIRSTPPGAAGFALLHMGLDGFQKVNEALGPELGDQLLVESAKRLQSLLRATDVIARTGGDEFTLILAGTHAEADVLLVARKILMAMQRPFVLAERHLHLSASIGIARFPEHAVEGLLLFRCAGIALSMAKEAGRNRFQLYVPEGGAANQQRVVLEERMYDAIQNGEFEMNYQPLFRADTRKLVGVEALMRWNHPGAGFVSPAEFIPLAEKNGLIGFLGTWSLRVCCHQVARWNESWGIRLGASVNLSPVQFRRGDLTATVLGALRESGLPAECLTLEITEGALMQDPENTQRLLDSLRESGVGISVDDFGTGYSSLAYLKRFRLTSLKIDRSFVNDLSRDANDQAIVSAIVSLAKELGLKVVAEGVQTEAQLAILQGKGCDVVQGYLLGKPVSVDEFARKVEMGEWSLTR